MIAPILLTTLVAAATPAPAPSPTLPPEIIHTVTSEQCSTLHKMMLPVGYVAKVNDQAFGEMAHSTQKFLSHFMPGDNPTVADLEAALGNSSGAPDPSATDNVSGIGAAPSQNGTGSALNAEQSSSREDDPLLYGPGQTLNAARIDAVAQQIYGNIQLERGYIKDSLKEYPPGTDSRVDDLRAKADNLIKLQGALADRYERFAFTYLSNIGTAQMQTQNASDLAYFKDSLRGLLLGATQGLGGGATTKSPAQNFGYDDVTQLAQNGSNGEIVAALRYNQYKFTSTLFDTYNVCHGTHFILAPPQAAPTPTP